MDTREKILVSAERLARERGYNGFSYTDIAEEVGIRKASLHHHFATKAELGKQLMARYSAAVGSELSRITATHSGADTQLSAYVDIYKTSLATGCLCLGGMLASDALTLDPAILPEVGSFFALNTEWLTEVFKTGESQGVFSLTTSPAEHARLFLAAVQGALLIARATSDQTGFDQATAVLMRSLQKT